MRIIAAVIIVWLILDAGVLAFLLWRAERMERLKPRPAGFGGRAR